MKRIAPAFVALGCAQLTAFAPGARAQSTLTGLGVKIHVSASASTGDIDGAFAQATDAFRQDWGSFDVACPLTLFRNGNPGSTSLTDGDISNSTEQNSLVFQSPATAYMIIVNGISYCAGTIQAVEVCAPAAIGPFLMADFALLPETPPTPEDRGVLLAHAFGKTLGVPVNGMTSAFEIIHNPVFASDTGVRDCNHCNHYYRTNFGLALSPLIISLTNSAQTCVNTAANSQGSLHASGTCSGAASRTDPGQGRLEPVWRQRQHAERSPPLQNLKRSIVDYATNVSWSQTPTDLHEIYSQADADQLRALLKDDALVSKRRKILTILGLVSTGTAEDVEALADYFQRPAADVAAAGMALGYIAARTGNEVALDFLLTQYGARDSKTAQGALYGLALSGKPEALRFIRERRLERAEAEPGSKANLRASYDDAERANLVVAAQGLKGYYAIER